MEQAPASRASRWRRRIIFVLFLIILLLPVIPIWLGWVGMVGLTSGPCLRTNTPAAYDMPFENVTMPSGDLTISAYFIPGETPAAVILAPPFLADAGAQLDYGRIFYDEGLSVLALPSRVCLGVPQTIGYLEGQDVQAAYTYLTTRSDVDPTRVSAHGFSAAGAAALFGAAITPELRGVSIMGNYEDFYEDFGMPTSGNGIVERMVMFGMRRSYHQTTGVSVEKLRPIAVIDQITPRPILLIYGSEEPSLDGGYEMYALARETADFWEVPGVGHGGYLAAYPAETREKLGSFHRQLLLDIPNAES